MLLDLAAVAAIFALAGLVKGVIGMGLPTVAIGLLGLMMTPAQAAALLILPSLISNVWQAAVGGYFRDLMRRLWPLLSGILIGSAISALYLAQRASANATIWLGVALAVYALLGLFKIEFGVPERHSGIIGWLCGVATGLVAVKAGVFAIPLVPYLQGLHLGRDRLVQALGLSFTTSTVALAAALQHAGEIHLDILWPSVTGLVAVLAGMVAGQWVRTKVSAETFRLFFYAGVLVLGLHLASRGLY